MKGVILAGGTGSRLRPLTVVTNKHLLPIYKKPMIQYPLETLIQAGIEEILIVTSGEHIGHFFRLLGVGKDWGVNLHYEIQEGSGGTGAALLLAEEFVGDQACMVILGDNIVFEDISEFVRDFEADTTHDAKVLIAQVDDPQNYGVVTFDGDRISRIVEKPENPESDYVNTGLWMFRPQVFERLRSIPLSPRGEHEVTDVLDAYAREGRLTYSLLNSPWTDAGSFSAMFRATVLMKELEDRLTSDE